MLFKVLVGVYIGILLKQRYHLPRVMTPPEMMEKVKETERAHRVEPPEEEEEEKAGRKRRSGWGWHHQRGGASISEAEQQKVEAQMKEVIDRLKNLEEMFRKSPEQAS